MASVPSWITIEAEDLFCTELKTLTINKLSIPQIGTVKVATEMTTEPTAKCCAEKTFQQPNTVPFQLVWQSQVIEAFCYAEI